MTGIAIGQPWPDGGFKDLRLATYQDDAAGRGALTAVVNATRGTNWSEERVARFYGHPAFALERDARLVWAGARPIGAAICYPTIHFHDRLPGNFEIFVVPAARGHGLGRRLLAHLEQAAPARGHRVLETTIDHQDAPGRSFLLAHGFRVIGQAAHLARPTLHDLPATDLPPGYALESLAEDPDAAEHYRELCNRLGAHDPGYTLIEPEERDTMQAGPAWEPAGSFVLRDPQGREVGVIRASTRAENGATDEATGYLHEIRLDPRQRGIGLGRALVGVALTYLADRGVPRAALDTGNIDTPPYRLAVRCGFVERHRWQQLLKPLDR